MRNPPVVDLMVMDMSSSLQIHNRKSMRHFTTYHQIKFTITIKVAAEVEILNMYTFVRRSAESFNKAYKST